MRMYRTYVYRGVDGPVRRLLDRGGADSTRTAQALRDLFSALQDVPAKDLLACDERDQVIVYLDDDDDRDLIRLLDSLPRGGVTRFIRAALWYAAGRDALLDVPALVDRLVEGLEERLVWSGPMITAETSEHDAEVIASLGQWEQG